MKLLCLVLGVASTPVLAQAPSCPPGQSVTLDTADHCCWPNQAWSSARQVCVGIPLCPEGFEVFAETCRLAGCSEGKQRSEDTGDHCCWPSQAWSGSRQICVGIPACPAGWTAAGEECVRWAAVTAPVAKAAVTAPVTKAEIAAPVEPPAAGKKTYFGIGARAFFIPADNRWGPAPELSAISVSDRFKVGALLALLVGDTLGLEAAARMSGGPSLGRGLSLDFGGEVGLILVPAKTSVALDFALNVLAASLKAGPALISVRLFSPTLYVGVASARIITRFGYQGGFTVAF